MPAPRSAFAPARMSGALPDGLRTDTDRPVMGGQDRGAEATLETRQPDVQWSPAGAARWVSVPDRQAAGAGDRVRTGPGARARLVYFEGIVTEIGSETGILVQRLEAGSEGNIITRLFQAAGSTVSRVVQLLDPAPSFEVETPAATAFVRGTTLRVHVGHDGTTRVANVPDDSASLVSVQGKDPDQSEVALLPGQETRVSPGLPPSTPGPMAPLADSPSEPAASEAQAQPQSLNAQQRREFAREQAQTAVAQAQLALIGLEAEMRRLDQQRQRLLQEILLLNTTPTPSVVGAPSARGPNPPMLTSLPLVTGASPVPPTATPSATRTSTAPVTATPTISNPPSATATPASTPPATDTPAPTSTPIPSATVIGTPTATATATATASPADCRPSGAPCHVALAPPQGPTASGTIQTGSCPTATTNNCLQFTSTGSGFTVQGVITGAGNRTVQVMISVVDAMGMPQGSHTVDCPPSFAGQALCSTVVPTVFAQVGGSVSASR